MIIINSSNICYRWRVILEDTFGEPVDNVWEIKPTRKNLRKLKSTLNQTPRYKHLCYFNILTYLNEYAQSSKYYAELFSFIVWRDRPVTESECLHRLKRHYS